MLLVTGSLLEEVRFHLESQGAHAAAQEVAQQMCEAEAGEGEGRGGTGECSCHPPLRKQGAGTQEARGPLMGTWGRAPHWHERKMAVWPRKGCPAVSAELEGQALHVGSSQRRAAWTVLHTEAGAGGSGGAGRRKEEAGP